PRRGEFLQGRVVDSGCHSRKPICFENRPSIEMISYESSQCRLPAIPCDSFPAVAESRYYFSPPTKSAKVHSRTEPCCCEDGLIHDADLFGLQRDDAHRPGRGGGDAAVPTGLLR